MFIDHCSDSIVKSVAFLNIRMYTERKTSLHPLLGACSVTSQLEELLQPFTI